MARVQDMCHTHVSHKWLHHLDACARSALTLHVLVTNVQTRLATERGHASVSADCVVPFLDPQLEHVETCSHCRSDPGAL